MSNVHDMTVDYLISEANEQHEDSDDDFIEFEGADKEEAEDRIYKEYRKRGGRGLREEEITQLAGGEDVNKLETSIVMSALQGRYQPAPYAGKQARPNMDMSMLRVSHNNNANQSMMFNDQFRRALDTSALLVPAMIPEAKTDRGSEATGSEQDHDDVGMSLVTSEKIAAAHREYKQNIPQRRNRNDKVAQSLEKYTQQVKDPIRESGELSNPSSGGSDHHLETQEAEARYN